MKKRGLKGRQGEYMKVFVTGVTGYIGGSVAMRLLEAGHSVRGMARNEGQFDTLRALGIEPVHGGLDDTQLLMREARAADAVINAASSDHRGAVESLLAALAGSGKALLHTSGSSVVGDAAAGARLNGKVYDEHTPLDVMPEKSARHALDTLVCQTEGVRGIVLCNSLIYGRGRGLQRDSVQVPALVSQAQDSGVVRTVGPGLNRWSTIHVEDMSDLYLLTLEQAKGRGFYFVENGESSFAEIAQSIARRLGISRIEQWTEAEAISYWGLNKARYSLGSNSRVRATRAREELGWKPRHPSVIQWILESI